MRLLFDGTDANLRGDADRAARRRRCRVQGRALCPARAVPGAAPHRGADGGARPARRMGRIARPPDGLRRRQGRVRTSAASWRRSWRSPEDAITMIEGDVGGGFGVRGEFYPEDFLIPFAARTARPAGEMDRGPPRAPDRDQPRARRRMRAGDRLRARRHHPRRCAATPHADVGAYHAHQRRDRRAQRRAGAVGALPHPEHPHRRRRCMSPTRRRSAPIAGRAASRPISSASGCSTWRRAISGSTGVEFRRRNLIAEAQMPYALATVVPLNIATETDTGDYRMTLDRCLAEFGWSEKAALQGKLIDGRYHGLAVGCYHRRRRVRPARERAHGAGDRRHGLGLCRLVGGRAGDRDDLRADRGRCAGDADRPHPRRAARLDHACARGLRLVLARARP